jgi:hypothetical protein
MIFLLTPIGLRVHVGISGTQKLIFPVRGPLLVVRLFTLYCQSGSKFKHDDVVRSHISTGHPPPSV